MPRDETREFEKAVVRARARLDDLKPLMLVANDLDREATPPHGVPVNAADDVVDVDVDEDATVDTSS